MRGRSIDDDLSEDLQGLRDHVLGRVGDAEHRAGFDRALVQKQIVAVKMNGNVDRPFCGGDAGYMVNVRVSQQDMANLKPLARDKRQ